MVEKYNLLIKTQLSSLHQLEGLKKTKKRFERLFFFLSCLSCTFIIVTDNKVLLDVVCWIKNKELLTIV